MRITSSKYLAIILLALTIPLYSQVETKITASDGASGDWFGSAVSTSNLRVVAGAHHDDDNGFSSGSIYIYEWDGATWVETKLIASDGAAGDLFGASVSTFEDRIVVGSQRDETFRGSAYIYEWDGATWVETKLVASDAVAHDNFGKHVSISGDRIVVGSPMDDDNGSDSGSAYIYEWDGASWIERKLTASDGEAGDIFGFRVSIDGDRIIVGARSEDDNGDASGAAYIYE